MFEFSLLGFPVRIRPWFWLSCFILGGGTSMRGEALDWIPVFEWTLVVLVSILIHELGHALLGRRFGGHAVIELHAFGGTTFLQGQLYTRPQNIVVSLAGPAFSIGLAVVSFLAWRYSPPISPVLDEIFKTSLYVNTWWTVFNLLPVMPMDGGQVMRDLLGPSRFRIACWIGAGTAVAAGCFMAVSGNYFAAVMLGFFAWFNYKGTVRAGGVSR